MVPTLRLVQLIALGAPLWLLGLVFPAGLLVAAIYLVVLAGACVVDYRSVPLADAFGIQRDFGRLSLGSVTDIRVVITNRSNTVLRVLMRDELPAALEQVSSLEPIEIGPKQEHEGMYQVRAVRRGIYRLKDMVIRVSRKGALVERDLRVRATNDLRIYPRFATVDEFRLLARIDRQDEASRRPRRVYGRGTDFESLATYTPGEDLRGVDWKISAKRGFLVSRILQTERGQQISVMIDGGRLMAERIGEFSRFEYALNAAVMLSYVAQKRGDSVAVATFSNRIESFVPPVRGAAVMRRVLESLCAVEQRHVESDYWQIVGQVMDRLKRRSLMIMMTDVLDSAGSSGLMNNLIRASSRHLVLCVVLTEPKIAEIAESEPRDVRETYMKAGASQLKLHRQLALEKMRSRGILVLEASPQQLTIQLIRRYLEIRKANLQ